MSRPRTSPAKAEEDGLGMLGAERVRGLEAECAARLRAWWGLFPGPAGLLDPHL